VTKKIFLRLCFSTLSFIFIIGSGEFLIAQGTSVPIVMQAPLFKKILAYDKKLAMTTSIKLIVAFSDSSTAEIDEIVKAFLGEGMSVRAVKVDQLASNLGDAAVIYISAGADSANLICQKNQILSITGIPSLVENGKASIGLGVVDNRPKILVHLKKLKEEGHEVSAKLLQLAKVIE
jgi:hypothetical protein